MITNFTNLHSDLCMYILLTERQASFSVNSHSFIHSRVRAQVLEKLKIYLPTFGTRERKRCIALQRQPSDEFRYVLQI